MEIAALILAVVNLVGAILDERRATAPKRERTELEHAYDDDVQRANEAITRGDANALTQLYDEERQTAIRRGDLEPAPPAVTGHSSRVTGPDAAPGPQRVRGGYAGTDQQ